MTVSLYIKTKGDRRYKPLNKNEDLSRRHHLRPALRPPMGDHPRHELDRRPRCESYRGSHPADRLEVGNVVRARCLPPPQESLLLAAS